MENRIYHVTRNLGKHAFALDDALYGTPVMVKKGEEDWAVQDPQKYVAALTEEYNFLNDRLDDFQYILNRNGIDVKVEIPEIDIGTADAHIYHKFTNRSFTYLEKIVYQLEGDCEKPLNKPKALRQLEAIKAALIDIKVSMVRYQHFADKA